MPTHILVIRFSAMGDVAMIVPVIKQILEQHPGLRITVVSNSFLQPLFEGLERCHFYPAYLKEQHKGLSGIIQLQKELSQLAKFDAIADLHSVLRSHIIASIFKVKGFTTVTVDKGRKEKKALTRKADKVFHQLSSMHERYAAVFRGLGIPVQLKHRTPVHAKKTLPAALQAVFSTGKKIIGVAPFAQYPEKMYPAEKMKIVVQQLSAANHIILLFGGGKEEAAILKKWETETFAVFNMAGRYSFTDELAIISNLDCMISMDSANMHLAALFNVPVFSIWGATHPFAGFLGWGQVEENSIQAELYCRPCSVFGNKPCYRGDHACMHLVEEAAIVDKVVQNF